MQRLVGLVLVAAVAASAASVPSAAAAPAPVPTRAKLVCGSAVTGVDSEGYVRYDLFENERLISSTRSSATIPFGVTAWGYYDSSTRGRRQKLILNAVSTDGRLRQVTLDRSKKSVEIGRVRGYEERGFTPRLYADGPTFFAYAVKRNTLRRYSLTRFNDGSTRLEKPVTLTKGLSQLTSLQSTTVRKVRGVPSEVLYGTTAAGGLLQFVVPLKHPTQLRVRTLLETGLAGVTELSWSICNRDYDYPSFIAIDPTGNRATWVTIENSIKKPQPVIHGSVTGVTDWSLTSAY